MVQNETSPLINVYQQGTAPPSSNNTPTTTIDSQTKLMLIITAASLVLLTLITSITVIPPGEIGVVVALGHATAFGPGLHLRSPLISNIHMFSTKTQLFESGNYVPTKEGLAVHLDLAVIYHINPETVSDLYTKIGPQYVNILIQPEATSALRILTADSEAKALYTDKRDLIQNQLKSMLQQKLLSRGVVLEDVLLKDVTLPPLLLQAIELKAQAEQDAMKMKYVLQKEEQEAERKAIEARGIAQFQSIVTSGISPELLQWKGIEATEKLAESENSKVVMMGNSKAGLPVLLNSDDGA